MWDWVASLWEWIVQLLAGPKPPVIVSIRAIPAVVNPGGSSTIEVTTRWGRRPYTYAVSATSGRVSPIGDGRVVWTDA